LLASYIATRYAMATNPATALRGHQLLHPHLLDGRREFADTWDLQEVDCLRTPHAGGHVCKGSSMRESAREIRLRRLALLVTFGVCVTFATIAATSLVAQAPTHSPASATAAISGVVRDHDGTTAVGARVLLRDDASGAQRVTVTDGRGHYRFDAVESRAYSIESVHGATSVSHKAFVRPGEQLQVDLLLKAPPAGWPLPPRETFLGLIVVTLLTLLLNEGGRTLLKKLGRPVAWAKNKAHQLLAPALPEMIGLRGYHRRISRSYLAHIENPVGSHDFEIPIERAFVPLRLMETDRDERIDVFQVLAEHDRLIVLGGPGTGKTTLMKSVVMGVLGGRSHEAQSGLIPVFVVLRDLATAGHSVEAGVLAAFQQFGFRNADRFVSAALEKGRLLIVLDGLDEVGVNREAVANKIRQFCQTDGMRPTRNHVIVTCREASYRIRDLADVIKSVTRIEPFTPQHMRQFLQVWPPYRGKTPLALYAPIQADPQVRDTCRNPLLLTILTALYLERDPFDLPSSRVQFYQVALKELLEDRPSRRNQKQQFTARDKLLILQKTALDRLETVSTDQDPEALNRSRINAFATEVLGPDAKPADLRALLEELVHVNGVVKYVTDEWLVFGHRTFQEYLAAHEAVRTRVSDEVVTYFCGRSELAEVLYFYCGLVHNVPQIQSILAMLATQAEATIAARALLSVGEPPHEELVRQIVNRLSNRIDSSRANQAEIEILASLAQRRGAAFVSARQQLVRIVDKIVSSLTEAGKSSIVAALSADLDLAMRLIPGLLEHPQKASRVAAVELLHDIGSVEALDMLVRLVINPHTDVRRAAAVSVSNLLRSRHEELRRLAEVLPERVDRHKWPFEDEMPGRLILPIAETLALAPKGMLASVENAVMRGAAHQLGLGSRDDRDKNRWRNAARDRAWSHRLRRARRSLTMGTYLSVFMVVALLMCAQLWCRYTDRIMLVQLERPWIMVADGSELSRLRVVASALKETVRAKFPPNASGIARLWPQNWFVEPAVPNDAAPAWEYLCHISEGRLGVRDIRPESIPNLSRLQLSSSALKELRDAISSVMSAIPPSSKQREILLYNSPSSSLLLALVAGLIANLLTSRVSWRRKRLSHLSSDGGAYVSSAEVEHYRPKRTASQNFTSDQRRSLAMLLALGPR
jgi:hypothetical protein